MTGPFLSPSDRILWILAHHGEKMKRSRLRAATRMRYALMNPIIATMAILVMLCTGTTGSAVTNVNQQVGQYNITFSIPDERNFNYKIAGPIPLTTTAGQWAGRTGTRSILEAVDQYTNDSLFMGIAKYDDPIAQAMCNSFAASQTPNWVAFNPNFEDILIYYNNISQYSAYIVINEYTVVYLNADFSKKDFQSILGSLIVETKNK
jgi:hypothetical protein